MRICLRMFCLMFLTRILPVETFSMPDSVAAITFSPIEHATFVIQTGKITIFVDPVGDSKLYTTFPKPDFILLTDIHRDHLSLKTVNKVKQKNTKIIGPQKVIDQLKFGDFLSNGESKTYKTLTVKAIAAYNTTKERLKFHEKGRGNGYVITINEKRIYISGDTEDIKEIRNLKEIDYAFVCMNLPYTMTIDQAASAVLEFKPKVVIPYHYRGKGGFSDMERFKKLVSSENKDIEVRFLKWYK